MEQSTDSCCGGNLDLFACSLDVNQGRIKCHHFSGKQSLLGLTTRDVLISRGCPLPVVSYLTPSIKANGMGCCFCIGGTASGFSTHSCTKLVASTKQLRELIKHAMWISNSMFCSWSQVDDGLSMVDNMDVKAVGSVPAIQCDWRWPRKQASWSWLLSLRAGKKNYQNTIIFVAKMWCPTERWKGLPFNFQVSTLHSSKKTQTKNAGNAFNRVQEYMYYYARLCNVRMDNAWHHTCVFFPFFLYGRFWL